MWKIEPGVRSVVPGPSKGSAMAKVHVGDVLDRRELTTIHGAAARFPEPGRLVHLQFRRYAGCPVCILHLREFAERHDDVLAAGVREVVFFHSRAETMLEFQGALPFAAVADPDKIHYTAFGVEPMTARSILAEMGKLVRSPRAAVTAVTTLAGVLRRAPSLRGAVGKGEEHLGLPADFLIDPDGRVLAAKYGTRVDDHWSVDELLDLAQRHAVRDTSERRRA